MNSFESILLIQVLLALIIAVTLCFAVWRLAKAGGSVEITLPSILVKWGNAK
jgi:hypothetical protein